MKLHYYKSVTIIGGKLYTSVDFTMDTEPEYGMSITEQGYKRLRTPATYAEYRVFWDRYDWMYRDRAMRTKDTVEHWVNRLEGKKYEVHVTQYIPNRHQRKHGIRMIERG